MTHEAVSTTERDLISQNSKLCCQQRNCQLPRTCEVKTNYTCFQTYTTIYPMHFNGTNQFLALQLFRHLHNRIVLMYFLVVPHLMFNVLTNCACAIELSSRQSYLIMSFRVTAQVTIFSLFSAGQQQDVELNLYCFVVLEKIPQNLIY